MKNCAFVAEIARLFEKHGVEWNQQVFTHWVAMDRKNENAQKERSCGKNELLRSGRRFRRLGDIRPTPELLPDS